MTSVVAHWHWMGPAYIRYVRHQPRQAAAELLERAAAAVTVAALVLRGERSDVAGGREVESFLARIPGAIVVECAGGGHAVGGDENSAFVDALAGFLDGTLSDRDGAIRTDR